jgi:hypothetical protein
MWVRGAAIRPVPRYALVASSALDQIERELADDSPRSRAELDGAFARFESSQPHLADTVSRILSRPLDETALALGYFLSISIFLAFERTFGEARMREVSADSLNATEQAIALEEELRAAHGDEPLDLDDVVSLEQPYVLAFVHDHVDAALEPSPPSSPHSRQAQGGDPAADDPHEIDVDDVHGVYRAIVLLTLCLSHAVVPVDGAARGRDELMA